MEGNTLYCLAKSIEDMVMTYGNCLVKDIKNSGLEDELEKFIEKAGEIYRKIEEVA